MQLKQFFDLIAEMVEGQEITSKIAQQAKDEGRELTNQEKEQFRRLFGIETAVRLWLPKFMRGCSCINCKHCTNDDKDYAICLQSSANEYTNIDDLCYNFEPIEL